MNDRYYKDIHSNIMFKQTKCVYGDIIVWDWHQYSREETRWVYIATERVDDVRYSRVEEISYEDFILEVL